MNTLVLYGGWVRHAVVTMAAILVAPAQECGKFVPHSIPQMTGDHQAEREQGVGQCCLGLF